MEYYLFEGNKLLVRNKKFQWLNSDAIWLQTLTSVLLTINQHLAVTVTGGGNEDVGDVTDTFTPDCFFCPGNCRNQIYTMNEKVFNKDGHSS